MLPDALPQLLDSLLRLPLLEAAQVRELIQQLPDPQACAQEMVRRGWITQNQFSALFAGPQQRPTLRETMLLGCADDESPPDADGDDWSLPLTDEEEDKADVAPEVEWTQPDRTDDAMLPAPETLKAIPVLSGAASTSRFESDVPVRLVPRGNEAHRRENDTDNRPRQWMGGKELLMCIVLLWSCFAGLQLFRASSAVPNSTGQNAPPAAAVAVPAAAAVVVPAAAPMAVPTVAPVAVQPKVPVAAEAPVTAEAPTGASDAEPISTASLYDRVRQVVLENKTEETERLGIGDFEYRDVPEDGSLMVGMEVTYAPFFNHNVIKSVRPIYQASDGTRYDGPVCGIPTGVSERVVAKEGYAIGGAAIRSGMGIDGMQLTFMEIGADQLNPRQTYLSKWLGGYGGANARTFVNDGRPIVGVAGMWSKLNFGPAFCLGLVTTKAGALADANGLERMQTPLPINRQVLPGSGPPSLSVIFPMASQPGQSQLSVGVKPPPGTVSSREPTPEESRARELDIAIAKWFERVAAVKEDLVRRGVMGAGVGFKAASWPAVWRDKVRDDFRVEFPDSDYRNYEWRLQFCLDVVAPRYRGR
jgi:hypothetical protein